ncbi:MAG: PfkB family carbohydrate kinase [Fimbriimonadales bacterium]|nr:PfkB family carbohydrate kinase [Fimbriimonadales bacterium]
MSHRPSAPVVAAGHLCVDLSPTLPPVEPANLVREGVLTEVGPLRVSVGGAAANTGQALWKLGFGVRIVAKVGDDPMALLAIERLRRTDPSLVRWLARDPVSHTSYTVVLNPPGRDRSFLHCPGANATFGPEDVPDDALEGARHLHFGYPPLMARMAGEGGARVVELFERAHRLGLTTSLDMSYPDPHGAAGNVDWEGYLRRVLPHTDVFVPSLDEIAIMLRCGERQPSFSQVEALVERLLDLGTSVVFLKLGSYGAFGRTRQGERLDRLIGKHGLDPGSWVGRQRYQPCFEARPVATTGSGDTAIAGFLGGILAGLGFDEAVTAGVAAGSSRVEKEDLVDGVPPWPKLLSRLAEWPTSALRLDP